MLPELGLKSPTRVCPSVGFSKFEYIMILGYESEIECYCKDLVCSLIQ